MKFDDLFAMPSFANGAARVLDLGSTLNEYNYSSSPNEADRLALKGNWTVVGDDLWKALDKFGQEKQLTE
ncbi:hypothetical protein G8J22_01354 [Lentilactobacillus hilgardii]|uniref:hypothetical protein n=1 Tax=Lentilactobacillus hilgardii TaxID=1588 RepID=UPI00019C644A|nr:hypothetical protein [Lentilactobacillus hilgardii]EEI18781.1 hypothetical protein HMPREF0497_2390 [Lentilactobacillus buchneri ATCC 11577]QIR09375.1 hypothetical protein G8J22_01354 [Lentilactobacillus hilgardii]